MKITDHQKLKYDRNINCRPRTKEHFWGSREHATEFLEQGNLTRVNFRERLNLFLGNKGETPIFVGTREHATPLGGPHRTSAPTNYLTFNYVNNIDLCSTILILIREPNAINEHIYIH